MAQKFHFHDEVIALLLTDDIAAERFAIILKDYEFPQDAQNEITARLLTFVDNWHRAPKEHAFELVEEKDRAYLRELSELATHLHRDYVLSRLDEFLREGSIRKTVGKTLDALQMGEWDEIERLFSSHERSRSTFFDPGMRLRGEELRALLAEDPNELVYRTGIKALDDAHIGPAPKTMLIFIAPPKRGKSWFLINQGVTSLQDRLSVVHVSLEMNVRQVARRYIQNMLSLTKRDVEAMDVTRLELDNVGRLQGFAFDKVKRPHVSTAVYEKANNLLSRYKFYVKDFPTRSLALDDLRRYLDSLEQISKVVPDVLILDYADLMRVDAANLRIDTGVLYQGLRGLAMERGIALVTASQSNRASSEVRWVSESMVSEDWSKIMTADTVLTYSQTPDERKLNLGRVFVSNARDEGDKWALLMTQAYAMGQFCLDSMRMPEETYWNIVDQANGRDTAEAG